MVIRRPTSLARLGSSQLQISTGRLRQPHTVYRELEFGDGGGGPSCHLLWSVERLLLAHGRDNNIISESFSWQAMPDVHWRSYELFNLVRNVIKFESNWQKLLEWGRRNNHLNDKVSPSCCERVTTANACKSCCAPSIGFHVVCSNSNST
jgi:hypothetical protein